MTLRLPAGLLIDRRSGAIYNSDSANTVRLKHALLCVGSLVVQPLHLVARGLLAVGEAARGRFARAGEHLRHAALIPAMLGVLVGASVLGLAHPYLGRSLFAWGEGWLGFRLAPCFAPLAYADENLNGSDLWRRDREQHLLQRELLGGRW